MINNMSPARNALTGKQRCSAAFTLMELLIVVAIIAMLCAIAVPNFLDAQTRSKVSRSRADLRAVATGLEIYRTDYNAYPLVGNPAMPGPWDLSVPYGKRLQILTSPVAYLQRIPGDVFARGEAAEPLGPEYCYAPGNLYHGAARIYTGSNYRGLVYSVSGRGPDSKIGVGGYCLAHPQAYHSRLAERGSYDATNGTVSQGDIVQLNCARM